MKNIENEIVKWLFFAEANGKISWMMNNVLKIDEYTRIYFDKEEKIISLIDYSESTRIFDNVFNNVSCKILWDMYNNHNRPIDLKNQEEALMVLKSRIEGMK
ncbi:hypothetical protein [Aeromonas phage AS-yj]|uniref:Uncharacterized protein n=3 Tax=Ceceduovirus aszj TaxID=2843652 RepID=A0A291LDW8_9CAUD|nr:hypothetical protein HWB28_gp153 [Aeromonas phage AS-zj]ASU00399.1 hypothetical protein [Aeromonas phage AS-zj]ATI17598.1 hypothetical protein [Aeromonas phage AS-szw]ATI17910.1 hypothetical protein [Aeromonas phage AS-yj]QAX98920.1 hypothetical protein assk_126 [Aeromonas phage Assk]